MQEWCLYIYCILFRLLSCIWGCGKFLREFSTCSLQVFSYFSHHFCRILHNHFHFFSKTILCIFIHAHFLMVFIDSQVHKYQYSFYLASLKFQDSPNNPKCQIICECYSGISVFLIELHNMLNSSGKFIYCLCKLKS